MEWRDDGVLLAVRPYCERDAILDILTAEHGRRLGLMRGGASRRRAAELQPGAQLSVTHRARLESHLGSLSVEASAMRAGRLLDDPFALAGLSAVAAMLATTLPEREPQPILYPQSVALLDAMRDPATWPGLYGEWELALLCELGFGLDLATCAATGSSQELIWVSPRSGRAVSRAAGEPYADKLLPLPAFLRLGGPADASEFSQALALTGHFFRKWIKPALGVSEPPARLRLVGLAAGRGA